MLKLSVMVILFFTLFILVSSFKSEKTNHEKDFSYTDTTRNCGIPDMYVKKSISIERRKWYKRHQRKYFKHEIGKKGTKKIFFKSDYFIKFLDKEIAKGIDSLRIYIASFPNSSDLPNRYKKKLTVVFVPLYKGPLEKKYYILNPNNHNMIDEYAGSKTWIDAFEGRRMNIPDSKIKDTRYIKYDIAKLIEFKKHIECLGASGMKIYFSSYMNTAGETSKINRMEYYNRMTVQFELTKKFLFFRRQINIEKGIDKAGLQPRDYNNGTLCPPCQNCDPGFMPPECTKK